MSGCRALQPMGVFVVDGWANLISINCSLVEGLKSLYDCLDDPSKFSNYHLVTAKALTIQYADNSSANGDYFTDNISFGGATIKSLEMGLGLSSFMDGLAGIGYARNEASWFAPSNDSSDAHFGKTPFIYPRIIGTMVNQGLINTQAYSIYLNSRHSSNGSIIFRTIDTAKYYGNLFETPVVPTTLENGTEVYNDLQVNLTAFSITNKMAQRKISCILTTSTSAILL
ncbi:acid protease [Stipitochalara longipes BDJ]|nr:acid protease [Stipitochalara longipes BDJ]